LKKIVLFGSLLGLSVFLCVMGTSNVSAATIDSGAMASTNTNAVTNPTVGVTNSDTTESKTTHPTHPASNDADTVQYDVGTVDEAIAEAEAQGSVTASNYSAIMMFSAAHLNSLSAYKKAGYKHITYSKWSGAHKFAGTKAKRMAKLAVEQLVGLAPGAQIKIALAGYDAIQASKTQNSDVWPTYNIRLISATAPRGNRAIIGQESVVKYYSNAKRTHLIKTIHRTVWVG